MNLLFGHKSIIYRRIHFEKIYFFVHDNYKSDKFYIDFQSNEFALDSFKIKYHSIRG